MLILRKAKEVRVMVEKEWTFRSKDRGYALWYGLDLFGERLLMRRWWGLFNGCGGQSVMLVNDEATAHKEVEIEMVRRIKRGYKLVNQLSWDNCLLESNLSLNCGTSKCASAA